MHILATQTATLEETEEAVDLEQSPADVIVMSFSDSDLSAMATAWEAGGRTLPSLRLADLKRLKHPMSVDLYIERVVDYAKVVVLRCLGGLEYWKYGLERIAAVARARGILLAALPGDDRADTNLSAFSTAPPDVLDRLDRYFRSGGAANLHQALRYLAALQGRPLEWEEPRALGPIVGFHEDGRTYDIGGLDQAGALGSGAMGPGTGFFAEGEETGEGASRSAALVIFYRALLMTGDTAPVSSLMQALRREGLAPVAAALTSLKDPDITADLDRLIAARRPKIILNMTAFSARREDGTTILDAADVPVLQVVPAGCSREAWAASMRGLSAADQAMHVVLPELDGRLLTRTISFKEEDAPDPALEYARVRHRPDPGRIAYVAQLAATWARLGVKPRAERRLAMILSDYPARAGRAGYAVGLDTAQSVAQISGLLHGEGFDVGAGVSAADVEGLLRLASDPADHVEAAGPAHAPAGVEIAVPARSEGLATGERSVQVGAAASPLPGCLAWQQRVSHDSGDTMATPTPAACSEGPDGSRGGDSVAANMSCLGRGEARESQAGDVEGDDSAAADVRIEALQRRRCLDGENHAIAATAPIGGRLTAVPPVAGISASGFSLPSSRYSDLNVPLVLYERWLAALPAELQSQIAGAWGAAADDPAVYGGAFRFRIICAGKLLIALQPDRGAKADRKAGYHDTATPPRHAYLAFYSWLHRAARIDALIHLGTHGTLEWLPGKALALREVCWPEVALGPVPIIYPFIVNNPGEAMQAKRRLGAVTIGHLTPPLRQAGLHGRLAELEGLLEEYAAADGRDHRRRHALEQAVLDLAHASGFATECGLAAADSGPRALARLDARLCDIKELSIQDSFHVFAQAPSQADQIALAAAIEAAAPAGLSDTERASARDALFVCAEREGAALLNALDGRRVAPGPAGAPTRGRIDVLPTGRNLTSIDPRAIPTRTAASIGRLAGEEVVRRYLQDHGEYPRALVLTLWASASLRTGGDDLAQALHYLGACPIWDALSNRVTGVEIIPLAKLGRPRIDVTLRISGLFRDLFEAQIALFDLAVRQVAARDEDDADNPLAEARRRGDDLARIFGGAPGSYGAGVAALALDTPWVSRAQLGQAALAAVTHRYAGRAATGAPHDGFAGRIASSSALVHPQDAADRDVLAGDDIADFTGGMAAAAALLGASPALYHLDTSRPTHPKARGMAESVARVVRGRLTNPKCLAGMLAHGYRGVAEIAQSIDALYALAATAETVPAHLFEAVHDALIADTAVFSTMTFHNPAAAASIAGRLQDALVRGIWAARRNAVAEELAGALARGCSQKALPEVAE